METRPSRIDVGALIIDAYAASRFPVGEQERLFLPRGAIQSVITRNVIIQAFDLQAGLPRLDTSDEELVKFTFNNARKLFAISVVSSVNGIDLKMAMHIFRRCNITDRSLPLLTSDAIFQRHPWEAATRMNFETNQWKFLEIVFSSSNIDIKMLPAAIFPFIRASKLTEGGFGTIYKATIHQSHMHTGTRVHPNNVRDKVFEPCCRLKVQSPYLRL